MFFTNKAIGPVVALSLLLGVAVVVGVTFQNWYPSFYTETFESYEAEPNKISIESFEEGILFVRNSGSSDINISTVKVGDKNCELNSTLNANSLTQIDLLNCTYNESIGFRDIILISDVAINSENIYLNDAAVDGSLMSCTLDGVEVEAGGNAIFYQFSSPAYPSVCNSSEVRTCSLGSLNGSYENSNCYYWNVSDWGACSDSCGGGTQTRNVSCIRASDDSIVADGFCDAGSEPTDSQACGGGGFSYGGYCYFDGTAGQNCDTVCSGRGGCDLTGTRYIGSSGTNARCIAVYSGLGFGTTFWGSGGGGAGFGCVYDTGASGGFRYTNTATICGSSLGPLRRMCACNS